jgi:hypothetical protein
MATNILQLNFSRRVLKRQFALAAISAWPEMQLSLDPKRQAKFAAARDMKPMLQINSTPVSQTASRPFRGVEIRRTVDLMRRWIWIERQCIPTLATWLLLTPRYETKIALGYLLWAHAERVTDLRNRLLELRGGHHDASIEPALTDLTEAVGVAPDADSFLAGWETLARALRAEYEEFLAMADPSANAQDLRVVRRAARDLQVCIDRASDDLRQVDPDTVGPWRDYISRMIDAAGGIGGNRERIATPSASPGSSPALLHPPEFRFDSRIRRGEFEDYQSRMALGFEAKRVAELQIYFNEFYAVGLLATVLIDAWSSAAPWEFFRDVAHHLWDEVRHAEFGLIRLRELDLEPAQVNLVLFEASRTMPYLHRLCYLTLGLEIFFMPRKRPRVKRYADAADHRTQLFADVDWSDESNHVQYGKRWVEYLLKDDARSVEDLQEEIAEYLKRAGLQLKDGQLAPY